MNKGTPFDASWFEGIRVNKPATDVRAAELTTRRSVKKKWQLAWELRAIQCIDLTTLAGDDTPSNVKRLCAKARNPINGEVLKSLGLDADVTITTGAVCVYPNHVAEAGTTKVIYSFFFHLFI